MSKHNVIARFTKKFVKGNLKDLEFRESMTFVDVKAAEKWHQQINLAKTLDYVIQDFQLDTLVK